MLEETRQKNSEKQAQMYARSERVRQYGDDAVYRQQTRTRSIESSQADNSRQERRSNYSGGYSGAYFDSYA